MRDNMVFTNTKMKKITKYVTTHWLRLEKFLDSVAIGCFTILFLSQFEDNDESKDDDKVYREVRLIRTFVESISQLLISTIYSYNLKNLLFTYYKNAH